MKVLDLVNFLLESRDVAHGLHWSAKRYGSHVALGDFYDDLLELLDDFVEVYQGQYGLLVGVAVNTSRKNVSASNAGAWVKSVAEKIVDCRACISVKDTHLLNILDEIVALCYKTAYKLNNLQ